MVVRLFVCVCLHYVIVQLLEGEHSHATCTVLLYYNNTILRFCISIKPTLSRITA